MIAFTESLIIMYQGMVRPYDLKMQNRLEMFNEVMIMLNCYFLFLFSEFLPDPEVRYQMGWVNIGMLSIMILVNTTIIIFNKCKSMYKFAKLNKIKRKNMKKAKLAKALRESKYLEDLMATKKDNEEAK